MEGNSCDSLPQLVNCQRPNIVLILMESISAENMRKLGGKEDIMPGLDSLAGEGMLFTRYYASGFRTEQGLVALISGFPAQPEATIMREFGKFERLANLGRDMKQAGYQCNYYFSGDLAFANTGAYLRSSGFTKLLDRDGRQWQRTTEWGSLDEELFSCHLQEAARDSMPFFSVIMTSTNHEPFDAPVSNHFKGGGEAQSYKNTSHYTDSCVYAYIQAAKRSDWWGNTLFIVTSDHAHYLPMNRAKNEPERHHVPFLLLGGALKPEFKGTSCATTSSQTDLPALLLSQLQLSAQAFNYSSNVLDPCKRHFAFYTFDNGFGMINDSSWLVYDHDLSKVVLESPGISLKAREDLLNFGKAYLQCMYKDYLER
jgi:phosphoglycerol transferase MdoB-like AlkP superfamily enzyme